MKKFNAKISLLIARRKLGTIMRPMAGASRTTRILPETTFLDMLRFERRRTERSGRSFMLALISGTESEAPEETILTCKVASALAFTARETDVLGWYKQGAALGLLMTEIVYADQATITILVEKISRAVQAAVGFDAFKCISLEFRMFPQQRGDIVDALLYRDIVQPGRRAWAQNIAKRSFDIVASLAGLLLFAPVLLIISVLVKITSPGPVLFRQSRVGQFGEPFSMLKFRTMYTGNDSKIHEDYVAQLISGTAAQANGMYKLVQDPRVTPLGRVLRKTSLDELPQFLNVLTNQMSVVGPRPPIPYEFERYKLWHRRRALEQKPGLTGLWQIKGRSRTTFEQMVRMDMEYAKRQSLWLDIKIVLQTPSAMLSGRGAC